MHCSVMQCVAEAYRLQGSMAAAAIELTVNDSAELTWCCFLPLTSKAAGHELKHKLGWSESESAVCQTV